jgi:alcohol dehydrogenase (NADP+)
MDYVDLYLMHWPGAFKSGDNMFPRGENKKPIPEDIDYVQTYKAMEKLVQTGKARAIGVSNFSRNEMERLLKECDTIPAVHQYECHPWLQQKSFSEWQQSKGIHITQYSPFGNQNEVYDGGKNMGKLVSQCSTYHWM